MQFVVILYIDVNVLYFLATTKAIGIYLLINIT